VNSVDIFEMKILGVLGRQRRTAGNFLERAALLAAAPTKASSDAAFRGPLASSGAGAPGGANQSSLAEQEWNLAHAGAVGGGAGGVAGSGSASSRPARAGSTPGSGGSVARSSRSAKAGLATGSQAAVVKLASFGAGSVRAGALLNYQSDKGELALEREDGTLVFGKEAVDDLAAEWRGEEGAREPSNDVLSFTLTLSEAATSEQVREALGVALEGHAFAWRMEETQAFVVMVAASAERNESGRLERIYANEKSLARLHEKIDGALNMSTSRSAERWTHGVEGATSELANLTKAGKIAAETSAGLAIDEAAGLLFRQKTRIDSAARPKGFNPNLELAKSWERGMRSQGQRDFGHIILSAKPGTDKEAFMDAARATLAKEFSGHEYVFVMHTNRRHIHVHAAVRLTHAEGQKLNPRIADFGRWRETLAEEARERKIPMEAVRRFDQAHAPGYKLKDIRMVERGVAPEGVRRRVARVKNKEIFRPTREEGRAHARAAAQQWTDLGERQKSFGELPPLASGAMRLYRAEPAAAAPDSHKTMIFNSDRAIAEGVARQVASRLVLLDVPAARVAEVLPARNRAENMYAVPVALGSLSQALERIDGAAIFPFQRRAEAALEPISHRENSGERVRRGDAAPSRRDVATMTEAREDIAATLTRISALLPDGEEKAAFEIERRRLVELSQDIIASQAKVEANAARRAAERAAKITKPEASERVQESSSPIEPPKASLDHSQPAFDPKAVSPDSASQGEDTQSQSRAPQRVLSQEEEKQHQRDIENRDAFRRREALKTAARPERQLTSEQEARQQLAIENRDAFLQREAQKSAARPEHQRVLSQEEEERRQRAVASLSPEEKEQHQRAIENRERFLQKQREKTEDESEGESM
jgi:hypothetical protein